VAKRGAPVFQGKVYQTTILPRNVRLCEAPSYGKPINLYDKRSAARAPTTRWAQEFLRWNGGEQ
jgi:chromosome partitioning protein